LVRLGGDDRSDRDLRLVQGSALDHLLSDKALSSRIASKLATTEVQEELSEGAKKALDELDDVWCLNHLAPRVKSLHARTDTGLTTDGPREVDGPSSADAMTCAVALLRAGAIQWRLSGSFNSPGGVTAMLVQLGRRAAEGFSYESNHACASLDERRVRNSHL
jgi:hypothetical protein